MGNSDSKAATTSADDGASTVVTSIGTKTSQMTDFTSFDGADQVDDADLDATPRRGTTKGSQRKNGQHLADKGDDGPRVITRAQSRDDEDVRERSNGMIHDEKIHINLAMADLMAYLQVVANNSTNLPLTRRDDPELDRIVSSLTSEDYARKSAAFVPADVRVLGGTFTRYGRVWDLPTGEEYNACDGAHEPGRSYGGACSNTMLKVVYDAVNDISGAAYTDAAAQALFDEDDDDEESTLGKSLKSGFSLEWTNPNPSTITWAQMLRQMRAEFKDIGYAQIPKITTSRKIDLNKPFSFVGDSFDTRTGKKRSLLIGCNYSKIKGAELKASHDDVRSMKDYIVNVHGFSESDDLMTVLMDAPGSKMPTFMNIIDAFKALSEESQPGDAVVVLFSGHGGRVLDSTADKEAESYDEVIVPSDYTKSGLIRDTLIFKTLLAPMRYGVTVTILIDCCDTGMVLELPYSWSTKPEKRDSVAKLSMNEDFSFVRFLKVVKTLYESSAFTQLGRTVGSALSPGGEKSRLHLTSSDDSVVERGDTNTMTDAITRSSNSIFDALTEACSPRRKDRSKPEIKKGKDTEGVLIKDSLLDKVMINCTLLGHPEDEFSDDEEATFKTRTEDEHDNSYDDTIGDSFESNLTDDESHRKPRTKRR